MEKTIGTVTIAGLELQGPYLYHHLRRMFSTKVQQPAVYVIDSLDGNYFYVGSSRDIRQRLAEHMYVLRKGIHPKKQLQECYRQHGGVTFSFRLCETLVEAQGREQYLLDQLHDKEGCTNTAIDAVKAWVMRPGTVHWNQGIARSEETRRKMSETTKQMYLDGRVSNMMGRRHSEETKRVIAEKAKGRVVSEETKAKLSSMRQGDAHSRALAVSINGVVYGSVKTASQVLGLKYGTTHWRVRTDRPQFKDWFFVDQ